MPRLPVVRARWEAHGQIVHPVWVWLLRGLLRPLLRSHVPHAARLSRPALPFRLESLLVGAECAGHIARVPVRSGVVRHRARSTLRFPERERAPHQSRHCGLARAFLHLSLGRRARLRQGPAPCRPPPRLIVAVGGAPWGERRRVRRCQRLLPLLGCLRVKVRPRRVPGVL